MEETIPEQKVDKLSAVEHKHSYIPYWLGALISGAIILSYTGANLLGYEVNEPRQLATLAIAGFAFIYCAAKNIKNK